MVKFTTEQVNRLMYEPQRIRNLSVIAHVDHGKTTLVDSLVSKAGIISEREQGDKLYMSRSKEEVQRSITMKSSSISLYYERTVKEEKVPYLINLIDSPGHVDFSSEVSAALRVTDGALVVVDCIEGVCVQTETVLQQAIGERIVPVLFLNKIDRAIAEKKYSPEEAYQDFRRTIESVNHVLGTFKCGNYPVPDLHPAAGNVGFGTGKYAWGFTIGQFAKIHKKKLGIKKDKLRKYLWGDYCWHEALGKFVKHDPKQGAYKDGAVLKRGFVEFVLEPIFDLIKALSAGEKAIYDPMLKQLNIAGLAPQDLQNEGKALMKVVMRKWLPAGDALLEMCIKHLPSPVDAQKYRCEVLYNGDQSDGICKSIQACDPDGPLSMYVSQMIPAGTKGRFIAFGRVFSGTLTKGQEVRVYGADYEPGSTRDLFVKKVQGVVIMMGRTEDAVKAIPCGNVAGVMGVEACLVKAGTLTTDPEAAPFRNMQFSVSPVVEAAVDVVHAKDIPKLSCGIKLVVKQDGVLQHKVTPAGEHLLCASGEFHLETCIAKLREFVGCALRVSEPIVSYCEGVAGATGGRPIAGADGRPLAKGTHPDTVVSKSPNKHNRIHATAEPLDEELTEAIDAGKVVPARKTEAVREQVRRFREEFAWDPTDAKRIWTFGCEPYGIPNILVDQTRQVQYLHEAKEHIIVGFQEACKGGCLMDEPWRGVRMNLKDVTLHADSIHRGAGQLIQTSRRAAFACQLASKPVLYEPVYLADIQVPQPQSGSVQNVLSKRRGETETFDQRGNMVYIRAFLPVAESFGFVEALRKATGGKAFAQLSFSKWQHAVGDPMSSGSAAYDVVMEARKRKGLKIELPAFSDYYDRV